MKATLNLIEDSFVVLKAYRSEISEFSGQVFIIFIFVHCEIPKRDGHISI